MKDLEVDPSRFVTERKDSIYNNYSMKEKLGEGRTNH